MVTTMVTKDQAVAISEIQGVTVKFTKTCDGYKDGDKLSVFEGKLGQISRS